MNWYGNITVYFVLMLLSVTCNSAYAGVAGHVQFVSGTVQLTSEAGKGRELKKGVEINEGDTLVTMPGASVQIKMKDEGVIALRPNTTLKIDNFNYNGQQDGSEKSFFSLVKGGLRAVTGLIGQTNKSNYSITTPTATIGIRGTDHETVVILPGGTQAVSVSAGTYNKVNLGETTMTTGKGTISVLPNQMGFAAASDQLPVIQPLNLNIFTVAAAPSSPAKLSVQEKLRDSTIGDAALQNKTTGVESTLPANTNFVMPNVNLTVFPIVPPPPPPPIAAPVPVCNSCSCGNVNQC